MQRIVVSEQFLPNRSSAPARAREEVSRPWLQRRLARFIASLSDEQLGRFERGLLRGVVLRTVPIVLRLRFKGDLVRDLQATIEFRWMDPRGGRPQYLEVSLSEGRCATRRGPSGRPTAVMSVGIADLIRMGVGAAATPMLIYEGRMRLNGDAFLIMQIPTLFGLPTEPLV